MDAAAARRAVALWSDRLATMARNIADLNEADDVRRLRRRLSPAGDPYEGATLASARGIAAALDGLWADYLLVSRTVDEAVDLARVRRFAPDRAAEAEALLDGPSIRLPSVAVPVGARGLLDPAERTTAVTPAAALDAMAAAFETARRGAAAIAAAETAGRIKLAALKVQAGARDPSLRPRLDAAERTIARDPLAAAPALASVAAALDGVRAGVEAAGRARAELGAGLDRARSDLSALRAGMQRRDEARRAAAALVVLDPASPDAVAGPDGLDAWLRRLGAAAAEPGRGDAVATGLTRWTAACGAALHAVEADLAGAARRETECRELRGRFCALRAKAEALAVEGDGDPRGVAEDAASEIAAVPFDAGRARAALARIDAAIHARPRRRVAES